MQSIQSQPSTDLICVPGDRLSILDENNVPGNGTYTRFGYIYSSLAGFVRVTHEGSQKVIEVISKAEHEANKSDATKEMDTT